MLDMPQFYKIFLIWLIQGDEYMPVESGYNKRVYINMLNLVVLPVIRLDQYPIILVLIITPIGYSLSSPYTTSVLSFHLIFGILETNRYHHHPQHHLQV